MWVFEYVVQHSRVTFWGLQRLCPGRVCADGVLQWLQVGSCIGERACAALYIMHCLNLCFADLCVGMID